MAEADPTQEKLKKYEKAVKKHKAANEKAAKELATQKSKERPLWHLQTQS